MIAFLDSANPDAITDGGCSFDVQQRVTRVRRSHGAVQACLLPTVSSALQLAHRA